MKIALACPYAWDAPGGVQVHVAELSERLQQRGHDVLVLAPGRTDRAQPWVRIVGRPVPVPYQGTVAPICFSARSASRIGAALRSFGPQLVHAHEPLTPSTAMLAAVRAHCPVLATFHAFSDRSILYSLAAPILRPVWSKLQVRIAVSEAAARFVGARFADGLRVIPNGCDVDAFARAGPREDLPAGRRMVWVGRLDEQKGFPVAVRAFARLAADVPDLSFVVVGEGRDRSAVSMLDQDARRRLVLAGSVAHPDLPGYLSGADVLVAPALGQESFGMVLVEAMAAGVPVVASDIPGYREVVRRDIDGLLVPPGDPNPLVEAVVRVLSSPSLATRLARAGRERAERFRWEAVVDQIESAYEETLRSR